MAHRSLETRGIAILFVIELCSPLNRLLEIDARVRRAAMLLRFCSRGECVSHGYPLSELQGIRSGERLQDKNIQIAKIAVDFAISTL
jgi:hypothetical protein